MPVSISRSGLHQRFTSKAVDYLKECFNYCLKTTLSNQSEISIKQFKKFEKILIFDSTVWDVHEKLQNIFKGFGGGCASKSGCKLQIVYNIKISSLEFLDLTSATASDTRYTDNIPHMINSDTLAIFDLGYFKLLTFKNIIEKKVFLFPDYEPGQTYMNISKKNIKRLI